MYTPLCYLSPREFPIEFRVTPPGYHTYIQPASQARKAQASQLHALLLAAIAVGSTYLYLSVCEHIALDHGIRISPVRLDVASSPHRVASLLRPQSRTAAWQRCLGAVCCPLDLGRRLRSRVVLGPSRWGERRANGLCGRHWLRVRAGQLIARAHSLSFAHKQDHPRIS